MVKAILIFMMGTTFAFLQNNMQFINPECKDKTLIIALIFSIPTSLCYIYSYGYFVNQFESAWSGKFILFGISYMISPMLIYMFLNESPFNLKTALCMLLSLLIVTIQVKL